MKKILFLGAGFLQSFVIKKARSLGYYVIAIDKNPNSIGFKYSNEHYVVDITDTEACFQLANRLNIDGVMTAATDYGVLSASMIAQHFGLPGISYEVATTIKDKYKVRKILSNKKVDSIMQYYEVDNIRRIEQLKKKLSYPVMVKPCDGSGSKAIRRVDSYKDLMEACGEAMNASLIGKALIESFIRGTEYGVESFVYDGNIFCLGVMKKIMTSPPDYAELGHLYPSQLDIEDDVRQFAVKVIQALDINFGAVNMDVLVSEDRHVHIVDIGARMGGNLIGSHIIPYGTGIDYLGNIIRATVNDPVYMTPASTSSAVATRLLALKPGIIKNLPDFNEMRKKYSVEIFHNLRIGHEIREYHNNLDGCGYVVAISNDVEEASFRAEEAKRYIDSNIIRILSN